MRKFLPVLLCLLVAGCGDSRWLRSVGAYSATAPILDQAAGAYISVNDIHTLQQEAVLVDTYSTQGYHPGEIHQFLSDEDLRSRRAAIQALRDYADLIGTLSIGKRTAEVDAKTRSLATITASARTATAANTTTSTTSSSNAVKVSSTQTNTTTTTSTSTLTNSRNAVMSPAQMNLVLSGLDSALKPFIRHMVKKRLPSLMKAADPTIQQLCTLLEADVETIRIQEQADYRVLLMEQSQFINKNILYPTTSRDQIMKLFQIEADAAKADANLKDTENSLKLMAEIHHKVAFSEDKQ